MILSTASVFTHFQELKDPRIERNKRHRLDNILFMTLCAVICGADNWVMIQMYCEAKRAWFEEVLDIPNGIPSHDTFGNVFAAIDQQVFAQCFVNWMRAVTSLTKGSVIALDGKSLRATRESGKACSAVHMVSAWACENKLVLGQQVVDKKSNEIKALPSLLASLDIAGCVITIDAMGCQTDIAEQIIEQNGDYVLSLKGNQSSLLDDVKTFFEMEEVPQSHNTFDAEHGRFETRKVRVSHQVDWLKERHPKWSHIQSIIAIDAHREISATGVQTQETRYFISSLKDVSADRVGYIVRAHWGIENGLHWVLDQAFDQDRLRAREGNSAANMAIIQQITLNLIKQETTSKGGVRTRRAKCGWDDTYLLKVLSGLSKI
jgi:predicted transposase YbfD/YdcC